MINDSNWASATQATGEPAPSVAGSAETFTVTGLSSSTTYYFAIKTSDEVPNESAISNVPSATTLNSTPTVAAAIADTSVFRDNPPVDNYRDLKVVFTDVEDGSALTFTIQSNTNPGLVTPTIGADSALDLSFTASTSGSATITVRATDSGALFVDDVFTVTVNDPPTVAAAIPDTTVNEDNPTIDNYRDLKAVFTDIEDGSGLTFVIQSNTNPGLVTPTIVAADSTLDLSFTAEGNGTATITVRATDSGALFVDDVFTVTVTSVNDQPTVIAAIPDTTVIENNPVIDNYRDLNAVFDDVEDGSALTFSIQNNTNPGLVTPTIGADSALDLSFTASTFGASTITIRATDGGALTVDDVFTVTVFQATGIAVATDDCDMGQDGSAMDATGSIDLFNTDEWGGFCFVNINIPQGSIIESALFKIYAWDTSDDSPRVYIDFEQVDSATVLTTAANNISNRWTETGNKVTWNQNNIGTGQASSPDLSVPLQAIIDRPGWKPGNTLMLLLDQFNSTDLEITGYGDDPARAARLDIQYTVVPNNPPTVASAIPDTTVTEDNAPIDNYRDLNSVFTDPEDGGQLNFIIQSNTNPGLVTPTIGADSALDLSFTASASGSATITVRATDSGALTVDDVFTVTVTDLSPPDAIADLATGTVTTSSIDLSWTAPGDDGATGTATTYDVRYSTSTITAGNWASATQATGEPAPQVAGSAETFTVTGLSESTTYFFAIKTSDEVPNESALSNVPSAATATTAPDAVTDLATGTVTTSSVDLSWTAPGDDGATGTARTYDVRYSTSTITAGNWASATQATGEPAPSVAGSAETFTVTGLSESTTYFFAIKTSDEVPNESALSNVPSATTADGTAPDAVTDLATGTVTTSSVDLSWTAPGDDGATGTATTYDVRYSTSTITAGNWASATQATGEPAPSVAGSAETFTVTGLSESTTYFFGATRRARSRRATGPRPRRRQASLRHRWRAAPRRSR